MRNKSLLMRNPLSLNKCFKSPNKRELLITLEPKLSLDTGKINKKGSSGLREKEILLVRQRAMNLWLRVAWQPPHRFPVLSLPAPLGHYVNLFQFYLPKRQHDVTSLLKTPYSHSFANENGSGLLILPFATLNYMAPVWHSTYTSSSAFYAPTKWCCSKHVSPFTSFSLISDCPYLLVFQDPFSVALLLKDILILNWKGSLVPLNLMVFGISTMAPDW